MQIKLKKTYRFAIRTSLFITVFLTLLSSVFLYIMHSFDWLYQLSFTVFTYITCFIIIQYRVERFIYRRVKRIYDDLTLLESTSLRNQPITTDMATLTREIDKYAKDKKVEIETLKIRENTRGVS